MSKPKKTQHEKYFAETHDRVYQANSDGYILAGLQSLRLIAAPDPKDDLTDDELSAFCQDPKHSPELIRHLIDFVKTI
jgi:hypothetical protein